MFRIMARKQLPVLTLQYDSTGEILLLLHDIIDVAYHFGMNQLLQNTLGQFRISYRLQLLPLCYYVVRNRLPSKKMSPNSVCRTKSNYNLHFARSRQVLEPP